MDFGTMLEGFRFGAPGSPSPLKRAKVAPTEEARVAKANHPAEDSWHVSDSVGADDADADDADAVTSTGTAHGEAARAFLDDTDEGDPSGRDGRGRRDRAAVETRVVAFRKASSAKHASTSRLDGETDERRAATYGDAVDADATSFDRPRSTVVSTGVARTAFGNETETAANRFFLPRGHPGRPDPHPPLWRAQLDAVRADRRRRGAAPVDAFHAFLLSLRDRKEPHFQALVACLLSVQCRDAVALAAAEKLREALGGDVTAGAVNAAATETVAEAIKTLNFKNAKARYVKQCAAMVATRFNGRTPRALVDLERLPGVGPKLARLVASVAFGETRAGLVVDTHVRRVAGRLGWTDAPRARSAEETRVRLETFLPKDEWEQTTLALIGFGQTTCVSLAPRCFECPVAATCPSFQPGESKKNPPKTPSSNFVADVEDL